MKNLKSLNRNLVYLIVTVIVVGTFVLLRPSNEPTPQGIFLPTTERVYPAQPAESVIIYENSAPGRRVIGNIRVELHFDQASEITETQVLHYARDLAAKAGAKGLVVNTFFGTNQEGLEQRYIFIGTAVV